MGLCRHNESHPSSTDHQLDAALAKMDENPDRIQIYKDTIYS